MMKDKLDRILVLIDDCDAVTDDDVRHILEDNDLKKLQNIASRTSDALTEIPEPDIDREWQLFEKRNFDKKPVGDVSRFSRFFSRNAAAVTIFIVATVAVVAATIGVSYTSKNQSEQNAPETKISVDRPVVNIAKSSVPESSEPVPSEETIIFKNQSLDGILTAIADFYGVSLKFKRDDSKYLRLYFQWDQSLPLKEIISQLNNFQQVNIRFDNNVLIIE